MILFRSILPILPCQSSMNKKEARDKKSIFLSGIFTIIIFCFSHLSFADEADKNLAQLKLQLTQQQQKISEQKKQQQFLLQALQFQEEQINQTIKQLQQQQQQLEKLKSSIQENQNKIKKLEAKIQQQKEQLGLLITTAYQQNLNPSLIEKLFSENARSSERIKQYYATFNQVKLSLLQQLNQDKQHLEKQRLLLIQQQTQQQQNITQQQNKKLNLEQLRQQREQTLIKLNNNLEQDQQRLETLRKNEQQLTIQIESSTQEAKLKHDSEQGLGIAKQQYPRPVKGTILHYFNQTQIGELRWKGIVIQAPQGSPVTAIASGRVILANWLQGYGLVVVIAHGKNDMTIYGYNQAIDVKIGDYVTAGQKIAEVGSSGGQDQTALYFEIRHKGVPYNPLNWLQR
ncbi:hypothetical protein CEP48_01165 [Mergibacter septicus]|uniref:M23ase beta-sheet core domain-containing protein n=1 Tax=Mergibacter septicus TaxID=221402 RepID=A0A8E3S854_9PAST|nr:peptidoglycan DD-metalloendopeptidase family protein [Mergibacter septicus]AWX14865.1 hypothetical protein CEP47_01165 [Mergibacter septicus]QDJ14117.1 hypothetical protein CEP48_01165 [Mergibacter septicus]UTU48433.1 peptidoglycan DD-metalloendopeptidase family protein [Mergibacter septicus]WMR95938.1 peptidoglycan DD-metalloendopeptidase family protein [Mergibacter septicus]